MPTGTPSTVPGTPPAASVPAERPRLTPPGRSGGSLSEGRLSGAAITAIELAGLAACCLAALALGVETIPLDTVVGSLVGAHDGQLADTVTAVRLPRVFVAIEVGASLAVAGALMQAITRNPIASPAVFGINNGASLAIVTVLIITGGVGMSTSLWLAFLGAAVAGGIVYLMASLGPGGLTPFRLTVAGAAISALFYSVTQGILVVDETTLDQAKRWLAGSIQGRRMEHAVTVLPFVAGGFALAIGLARSLTSLTLGDDMARSLGIRVGLIKGLAAAAVVLLAGSAVALAGPVAFVGLAVPHIVRYLVGTDYRRVLPHALILGGALLVTADIVARLVIRPEELAVGVVTAIIGTPVFIHFARRNIKGV